jgi:hypothetical protein
MSGDGLPPGYEAAHLHPWLLERQVDVLPEQPSVPDLSNLVAAIARHRVNTPSGRRRR